MKRILCLVLALVMLLGAFGGCGKKKNKDKTSSSDPSSAVATMAPTPSPTPPQTAKAAKVKATSGLNIRSRPSTEGEILGLAEDGSKLPLLMENPSDGWYQIEYNGKTAYISADYASVVEVTLDEYNKLRAGDTPPETEPTAKPTETANSDDPQAKPTASAAPASSGDEDGE